MFAATSPYAALLAALFLVLSARVIFARRSASVSLGDGGDPALQRRIRAHGNCAEYAVFGLFLLALAEAGGLPGPWVHLLGLMLLLGRLSHAYALSFEGAGQAFRVAGMGLTFTQIGVTAAVLLVEGVL
ncbi:MAPEG family protein [Oceaniglobus roseus]|uniref:MAPEG family protein n=1 Tax=Oceaniglobus roseus TaxID=1737570 RepID=UPI000C7F6AED|nr:MAPEG family protein [Kandeliimicrobium roseum]